MSLLLRLLPQSRRTQPGSNLQVHKVDGSHQGSNMYVQKEDGPNQGSNLPAHKVDGSHQGSTRSTKRTDPTRVKLIQTKKVDGPNRGQTYITPKRGRALQTFKTPIHIMDGPNQFIKLYKSTKWTPIRGHDHIPRNERTLPESQIL